MLCCAVESRIWSSSGLQRNGRQKRQVQASSYGEKTEKLMREAGADTARLEVEVGESI